MPPIKKRKVSGEKNTALETISSNLPTELNSLNGNEIKLSCARVGVSLDDYISAIKFALAATKITGRDEQGEPQTEPDHDKRLKAALMGLELEGYIRSKDAATQVTHNKVVYQWLNAPNAQVIASRIE